MRHLSRTKIYEHAMQKQALGVVGVQHSRVPANDPSCAVLLLRKCINLDECRRLHADLRRRGGLDSLTFVGNTLVQMYGKLGSLEEAHTAFERIANKNVFSWSIIIGLFSRHRLFKQAVQLFDRMDVTPNEVTFINVIGACRCLETGKRIHALVAAQSLESEVNLANSLITMYSTCGSLLLARKHFDRMTCRNVVSWNCIMAAYAQHGHFLEVVELFNNMERSGERADRVSFVNVFTACACLRDLSKGAEFQSRFVDSRLQMDVSIGNTLINMYAKCGSLEDARYAFDGISSKTVVTWTSIISAHVQFEQFDQAHELYQRMDVKPNEVTYFTILGACGEAGDMKKAKNIHSELLATDTFSKHQTSIGNSLINTYTKCGSLLDARNVFQSLASKSVVTWTSMIAAYAHNRHPRQALVTFHQMELEGVEPNEITLCTVVSAVSELGHGFQRDARFLHQRIVACGHDWDTVICNGIINMFSKFGMVDDSKSVFDAMQRRSYVSWTAMIGAYVQRQETEKALALFRLMDLEGVTPTSITLVSLIDGCSGSRFTSEKHLETIKLIHRSCITGTEMEKSTEVGTSIVNMYWRCNEVEQAREAFERIEYKDVMAWTAMVAVYAQSGQGDESLKLYQRMGLEGVSPDEITFVNLMLACSRSGAKRKGREIYSHVLESGLLGSEVLGNAIVCFYGVCGTWFEARGVFERMVSKDVGAWNAAIGVSGQHGYYDESLWLFKEMILEGVRPDDITFTNVLFSCSHSGVIENACDWFRLMTGEHGLEPNREHLSCMIDLFGRSGWLSQAEELADSLPDGGASIAWMSLLSGCKVHGDLVAAERAAERVMVLEPTKSAPYVVLSHLYRSSGSC